MENKKVFFDGADAIAGRLSSLAAKTALNGDSVIIFNCEKCFIKGDRKDVINGFLKKRGRRGQIQKGPFYPTTPERILKRMIRGMLPYKNERGALALKRVRCFAGQVELNNEKPIKIGEGEKIRGVSLKEISKLLNGGVEK